MTLPRAVLVFVIIAAAAWLTSGVRPPVPTAAKPRAVPAAAPAASPSGVAAPTAVATEPAPDSPALKLVYASAWEQPLPPAMAAFRDWTVRYRAAPAPERPALVDEGLRLARARRPEMRRLIVTDPERALAVTLPAAVRRDLPAAILGELETRHAGRGDFAWQASLPEPGAPPTEPALRRIVWLGGATYSARPYGRREAQLTKEGASLHGIALDGEFALHESPVRLAEPGEFEAAALPAVCAACAEAAGADAAVIEAEGQLRRMHPEELAAFAELLVGTEDAAGPRVPAVVASSAAGTAPPRAANPATPHTIGTKQVLVIRVDFSDFPGDPLSQTSAQNVLTGAVRSFFTENSYGQTDLVTTVTAQTYRLARTGADYATSNDRTGLHADARAAAAAAYPAANYDRIIVLFPNLGTARVPGSRITFGGLANVSGTNAWINGPNSFVFGTVSHELGHNYGLLHGNLWRVTDRNPVSDQGNTLEYGDPFDMMGSSTVTGVTRDLRHHFNQWSKNLLGWLPDTAVTTATTSGIYRIYRFDSRASPRDRPLALRVFRDGVRSYWVGLRQSFATGTPQSDGAYVVWGYHQRLQSQLLDFTTPGTSATDAALALDTTFTDAPYGVTIRPVARGGTEPEQWLDIEVTVPPVAPGVVAAWGREGATFFDTETGEDLVPAPETNVAAGLTGVQAIAAGDQHALALKTDGTVVAWGNHTSGQIAVPAGLTDVVSIAAGGHVSGAVKRDGTVVLWGDPASGSLTPPAGLTRVRQLAIGGGNSARIYHALALRDDGTIVAWGDDTRNQADPPATLGPVVAVAAGDRTSHALRADGTVARWGTNFTGALPLPPGLGGVVAIASSGIAGHALALKSDGTVVGWGVNTSGQATPPEGLADVVAIATGGSHSLALKSDGSVVVWGSTTGGRGLVPPALPRAGAVAGSGSASFALAGPGFRIAEPPASQTVAVGGSATLRVQTAAGMPLAYQWRKDGVALPGATAAALTIARAAAADAGRYDVLVTGPGIALTSAAATLTVGNTPGAGTGGRIANLSIRTRGGTGAETLIVGFVIGGAATSGTKPLLLRGVGPTLSAFGVGGTLADPKLELYGATGAKLFENDNWLAADAATFARLGAFALTAESRDAALYNAALQPGGYSAQISGTGGATGIVLAEIYDATSADTFGATTPRLVNVSARAVSGTGADVLIAGFVVAGTGSKTVLIRGIGPTLGAFGVTDVLADPKLELFNANAVKVQENDNWGGTGALTAAFSSVGAFALQAGSRDAALLATLPPGSYTAQVSGVGGTGGVALVEVYEVP